MRCESQRYEDKVSFHSSNTLLLSISGQESGLLNIYQELYSDGSWCFHKAGDVSGSNTFHASFFFSHTWCIRWMQFCIGTKVCIDFVLILKSGLTYRLLSHLQWREDALVYIYLYICIFVCMDVCVSVFCFSSFSLLLQVLFLSFLSPWLLTWRLNFYRSASDISKESNWEMWHQHLLRVELSIAPLFLHTLLFLQSMVWIHKKNWLDSAHAYFQYCWWVILMRNFSSCFPLLEVLYESEVILCYKV